MSSKSQSPEAGSRRPLLAAIGALGSAVTLLFFANDVRDTLNPEKKDAIASYYGHPAPKLVGPALDAATDAGKIRITLYRDGHSDFAFEGFQKLELVTGSIACADIKTLNFNIVTHGVNLPPALAEQVPTTGSITDSSTFAQTACQSGSITPDSLANLQNLPAASNG